MPLSTRVRADFYYRANGAPLLLGRGDLRLWKENEIIISIPSRTGSVGLDGNLKNACPIGKRFLCDGPIDPVASELEAMAVDGKPWKPFKQRLWPYPVPQGHVKIDGILIHYDGKYGPGWGNGTDGCIGTLDDSEIWRLYMIGHFYDRNADVIPIEIGLIV